MSEGALRCVVGRIAREFWDLIDYLGALWTMFWKVKQSLLNLAKFDTGITSVSCSVFYVDVTVEKERFASEMLRVVGTTVSILMTGI